MDLTFVVSSIPLLGQFLVFLRNHKGRVPFGSSVWALAPLSLAAIGNASYLHMLLSQFVFSVLAYSWVVRVLALLALVEASVLALLHFWTRRIALRRI